MQVLCVVAVRLGSLVRVKIFYVEELLKNFMQASKMCEWNEF